MSLTILKASAGSGKTFRLTREYIRLCLEQESEAYAAHILAITFTNKATAEMKSRILETLAELATGAIFPSAPDDPIFDICTELGQAEVQKRAGNILRFLLRQYHYFGVSTIDSFFQRVIRQFQRELHIDQPYSVELNTTVVLEAAVRRLLDRLERGDQALQWMSDWIEDQFEAGKSWDIRKNLMELGSELFRESVIENWETLNLSELESIKKEMDVFCKDVDDRFAATQSQVTALLGSSGLSPDDFSYGKSSFIATWLNKKNIFDLTGKRFQEDARQIENWYTKKAPGHTISLIQQISGEILALHDTVLAIQEDTGSRYLSYKAVLRNFRNFVALRFLYDNMIEWCREQDVMLLSEANRLVSRVVADADVSLLFEKMGQRLHHLLIDEFQDTSRTQWTNLRPLLENSLSEDRYSLIVGDIKQAIYRWRGGDWRLMYSGVAEDLAHYITLIREELLDTNWRSAPAIVQFNNELFGKAAHIIADLFLAAYEGHPLREAVRYIYEDVAQHAARSERPGQVRLTILPDEEREDPEPADPQQTYLRQVLAELFEAGYRPSDIALLVRTSRESAQAVGWITGFFADTGDQRYQAISDNGFLLAGNALVQLLVSALRYRLTPADRSLEAAIRYFRYRLDHPDAPPGNAWTSTEDTAALIPDQSLTTLSEWFAGLIRSWDYEAASPAYATAFLDLVRDFELGNGNDPYGFLVYWDSCAATAGIPAEGRIEAIQVLTVHKSKGLQFPVVVLPFTDVPLVRLKGNLYVTAEEDPLLSRLGAVPVDFNNKLKETRFNGDFADEYILQAIDSLNLLYVATTRAEERLYAALTAPKEKTGLSTWNDLILEALPATMTALADGWMMGDPHDPWPKKTEDRTVHTISRLSLRDRAVSTGAWLPRALPGSTADTSGPGRRGILLHLALEHIAEPEDIGTAIRYLHEEGLVDNQESTELQEDLARFLSHPDVAPWFVAGLRVYREKEIIQVDGKAYRPDRVVLLPEQTIIIDFKTGQPDRRYEKQLRHYAGLLAQMGLPTPEAWIAYTDPVQIHPVEITVR